MSVPADITRIADEATRLSHEIERYDHAPAELRDTIDLLESLERDLNVREGRMDKLVSKRKEEHKDLDKLQRSGTRRFFVKIKHGGKEGLERKLEKEEREYIEAAQKEYNENKAIAELKAAAETARQKKADLESHVASRKEMIEKLDALYKSTFEGPSPGFPEEDAAENELKEAEAHYDQIQAQLSHEKSVFNTLDQAAACANQTQAALQSANLSATYDTFQLGGLWAQMAEADDLVRAQTLSSKAQRLLDRARALQPLVRSVPSPKIVQPEWLNVVFDNFYTDYMFQQKIKQSIDSVTKYQQGIYALCAESEDRLKALEQTAKDAKEFLNSRRRQLVAIRREILARIREEGGVRVLTGPNGDSLGGGSGSIPQLPMYMQQPEEGARTLETGRSQSSITMPVPSHGGTPSPPRYDSQPSFSQTRSFNASGPFVPPPGPPPPRTLERGSSSTSSIPEPSHHVPADVTSVRSEGITEGTGLSRASDAGPRQSMSMVADRDQDRENSRQTSFASNNPYRIVS